MQVDAQELLARLNKELDSCKLMSEKDRIMAIVCWVEEKMNDWDRELNDQLARKL